MSDLLHFTVPVRHDATYSRNQQGLVRKVGTDESAKLVASFRAQARAAAVSRQAEVGKTYVLTASESGASQQAGIPAAPIRSDWSDGQ
jgi:hypothetical protein